MSYVPTGLSKTAWAASPGSVILGAPSKATSVPTAPGTPGADMPVAEIKSFPWIIPALGVLALGGFIYYRRRRQKAAQKGPTP